MDAVIKNILDRLENLENIVGNLANGNTGVIAQRAFNDTLSTLKNEVNEALLKGEGPGATQWKNLTGISQLPSPSQIPQLYDNGKYDLHRREEVDKIYRDVFLPLSFASWWIQDNGDWPELIGTEDKQLFRLVTKSDADNKVCLDLHKNGTINLSVYVPVEKQWVKCSEQYMEPHVVRLAYEALLQQKMPQVKPDALRIFLQWMADFKVCERMYDDPNDTLDKSGFRLVDLPKGEGYRIEWVHAHGALTVGWKMKDGLVVPTKVFADFNPPVGVEAPSVHVEWQHLGWLTQNNLLDEMKMSIEAEFY